MVVSFAKSDAHVRNDVTPHKGTVRRRKKRSVETAAPPAEKSATAAQSPATAQDGARTSRSTSSLLDREQVHKAVQALLTHEKKRAAAESSSALLDTEQNVSLVIALKKLPLERRTKPYRISLKHPLYRPGECEVCFIVKDPQRAVKDVLAREGSAGVTKVLHTCLKCRPHSRLLRIIVGDEFCTKVLGVSKLRARYKSFEGRRELCASYDLFLADDRVLEVLPKLLGNVFFRTKKIPAPVSIGRGNVVDEVRKAMASTYLHLGAGSCSAVRVGSTSFTAKDVTDNIMTAFDDIARVVPYKLRNVQNVHLKTPSSVALPIYNSLPTEEDELVASDVLEAPPKRAKKA